MGQGTSGGWIAFAVMAFIVAGLAGVFATYALPIAMERAFAVDTALDEALVAARGPNPDRAIAALAPRLGESAASITQGTGSWEDRIQRERAAMRARFIAEEEATATRLRWLIVVVNLMGAIFVGAVVSIVSRRPAIPGP